MKELQYILHTTFLKTNPATRAGSISHSNRRDQFLQMQIVTCSYSFGAAMRISSLTKGSYFSKFLMNCSANLFAIAS